MSADLNNAEIWLIEFIKNNNDVSSEDIEDIISINLFENGFIDSMGIMNLIVEIERDFNIYFVPTDFQDRRFSTISGLAEMINEKNNDI